MFTKIFRISAAPFFVAALIALSAPAYPADNAVITADSVSVRTQPSVWEDVRGTLDEGARVEVISRTDFTDTIDGYAAPWYGIVYGEYGGFVFGRYVKVDPGTVVLPLPTNDIYGDRVSRFIVRGLYRFGKGMPDVMKTLGQPISSVHENAEGLVIGVDTLTYDGLVISTRQIESGRTFVFTVDCTTSAYDFNGLKVGDTFFDMQRILGPPTEPYKPGDETVTYYNVSGFEWVTFTLRNEVIVEIAFYAGMAD
jgi:hypothetical protein